MQSKRLKILLLLLSVSLFGNIAKADFGRALDAYIKKDAEAMFKEVQQAVDSGNCNGLILFISAIDIDYMSSRRAAFVPNSNNQKKHTSHVKSTFEMLFNKGQQKKVAFLLDEITKKVSPEARYKFVHSILFKSIFNNKKLKEEIRLLSKKGLASASYELRHEGTDFLKTYDKAISDGSARAAYELATDCYLNKGNLTPLSKFNACKSENRIKAAHWLKKAYLLNDRNPLLTGAISEKVSYLYSKGFHNMPPDMEEAYRWAQLSRNSAYGAQGSFKNLFDGFKKSKRLPSTKKVAQPPEWFKSRQLVLNEKPIFSYYTTSVRYATDSYMGGGLAIDLYNDGQAKLSIGGHQLRTENIETIWKLSPKKLKIFKKELDKLGISNWPLVMRSESICMHLTDCPAPVNYYFTTRGHDYERTFGMTLNKDSDLLSVNGNRLSKILGLIEKFFPTRELRCQLGSSKRYQQECLEFDQLIEKTAIVDLKE